MTHGHHHHHGGHHHSGGGGHHHHHHHGGHHHHGHHHHHHHHGHGPALPGFPVRSLYRPTTTVEAPLLEPMPHSSGSNSRLCQFLACCLILVMVVTLLYAFGWL